MKIEISKIIIALSCILLFSCNMSDSSEELNGGYTFVHEGENYNFIYGKHFIYPNVIEYKYNKDYIVASQKPNKDLYKSLLQSNLSGNYSAYNSYLKDSLTEKYFKSRREILKDSSISKIYKNRKISFENTEEDIRKGNEIVDSILKNDPIHKKVFSQSKTFWVILIKNDSLIGPLTSEEYQQVVKKIRIPKELFVKN